MSTARLEPKYNAILPKYLGVICYPNISSNYPNHAKAIPMDTIKELVEYFKWKSTTYLGMGFKRDSIYKPVMYAYELNETKSEYVAKYMYSIGPKGGIKRKNRNKND
ncbi:hypothetical protein SEA_ROBINSPARKLES_114 [Gordonia phage RobinSparkles]|nr:hypothetical protein SEA_ROBINSPARKLES_114 [Gordonia phage RobinSparkles]